MNALDDLDDLEDELGLDHTLYLSHKSAMQCGICDRYVCNSSCPYFVDNFIDDNFIK